MKNVHACVSVFHFWYTHCMSNQTNASYGIIPVRKTPESVEFFLIKQYSRIGDNTYWVFPKGHAEGDESPVQAAERELFEETGMTCARIHQQPQFTLSYDFLFAGKRIDKTVTFFLGVIENESIVLHPEEVREAGWFGIEEAYQRLDYDDTKKLFLQVREYLETHEGLL